MIFNTTSKVPAKTSDLVNDSGFLTANNAVTGVKGNAESAYRTGDVNITPQNIGALPTSGGIVYGDIAHQDTGADASQSNNGVSSTHWAHVGLVYDAAGRALLGLTPEIQPNGDITALLYARNYNANGDIVGQNHIMLGVDKLGQASYAVSAPDAFRSAISAAAASHSHTAAEVGAIPAANELPEYVDLNSVWTSGFYRLPGNIQNAPPETVSYGQLIVSKNNDTTLQIAASYYETDKIFYRMGWGIGTSNQQYTTWQRLAYALPSASASVKGGIKIGPGLFTYDDALYIKPPNMTRVTLSSAAYIADNAPIYGIYTAQYRDPFMVVLWTLSNSVYTPHVLMRVAESQGIVAFGQSADMTTVNTALADTVNGVHYSRVVSHFRYNSANGEIYMYSVGTGYKGTSGNTAAAVPIYADLYDLRA